jgi:quercetin dioxygenase-like cupin family protein
MMSFKNIAGVCLMVLIAVSCNQQRKAAQKVGSDLQRTSIFPKGEKITNNNFVGSAWLHQMVQPDSLNQIAVGSVTFEPRARTKWHYHPSGQILLATGGVGYYQEKGSQKRLLRKGDVVKCPPNVPHWHGASHDQQFIQIAITSSQNGPTVWLLPVSNEEYNSNQ